MADRQVQQELDALKQDIGKLRSDLRSLVQSVMSATRGSAGSAGSRLQQQAQVRLQWLRESMESARHRGREAMEKVEHRVVERPLTSILIAVGVGLVVGRILMGRR